MKIEQRVPVGATRQARRGGGADASGSAFEPELEAAGGVAAASGLGAVASLDALLALQADDFDQGRRGRQLTRGRQALDTLEALAGGLLSGRTPADMKAQLAALGAASEATGEPGLDAILLEIDIRVAVELAKLERSAVRAA